MNQEVSKVQFCSRLAIFTLQLVVIATLLWASEYSEARSSQPPDVGYWHNDDDRKTWIAGLTDEMNDKTKKAYYKLKKGPLKGGWKVVRKRVAESLQLVQDYPSAVCHDNMKAADAGTVRMTCTYKENGKTKTKTYKHLTTTYFDEHFDDNFLTVAEYHRDKMQGNSTASSPYGQYHDSQGNSKYTQEQQSQTGSAGGPSYSNNPQSIASTYTRYINNHVAPRYKNINRSTASVFSQGDEQGLTLEEILKKDKAEFAPGIKEGSGKLKIAPEKSKKP